MYIILLMYEIKVEPCVHVICTCNSESVAEASAIWSV